MPPRQRPHDPIPPMDETLEHRAFIYYVLHKPIKEISKLIDVPAGTIRSWKYRRGWDRGIEEVREELAKRYPTAEEPHVVAAIESRDAIAKEYESDMQQAARKFGKHVVKMKPEQMLKNAPKIDAMDKVAGRRLKLDADEQGNNGAHISLTFLGVQAEQAVRLITQPAVPLLQDSGD